MSLQQFMHESFLIDPAPDDFRIADQSGAKNIIMQIIILFASICVASGLLFTNLYNSLIDTRSWGRELPSSIGTARAYFTSVNPGNFYRLFSPLNQLLSILAVVFFWRSYPDARFSLSIALMIYILVDVFTFTYFYPRNKILFISSSNDVLKLRKAWSEWNRMNWARTLLVLAGVCFSFLSLYKIFLKH